MSRRKKEFLASFGPTLRRVRLARGLTLAAVGKALDRGESAVQKWERGVSEPNLVEFTKLATLLDVSADSLLGLQELTGDAGVAVRHDLPRLREKLLESASSIEEAEQVLGELEADPLRKPERKRGAEPRRKKRNGRQP